MTTEELLAALAAAVARNDAVITAEILDILETLLPADELADRLEALLQSPGDDPVQVALCA